MIKEAAIKASRNGATAAFISAGLGFLVISFAIWSNSQDARFSYMNDPWAFVDVFIVLACGIGLRRYSRAAAILLVIYWIYAKTYQFLETGTAAGFIVALIFLYFFGKAVQGTFAYHKIRRTENPDYKPSSKWAYIIGIPSLLVLIMLLGLGLLSMTDYMPSTKVVSGTEISTTDQEALLKNEIIFEGESIEYFYSYGFSSILEGGSILSDMGVTAFHTNEQDDIESYWFPFDQIASVELIEIGNLVNDSVYRVNGFDEESWFHINLSTEESGDVKFVEALRKKLAEGQIESKESTERQ